MPIVLHRAAASVLPAPWRSWLRARHRALTLARGLSRLDGLVSRNGGEIPDELLRQLIYGWGNEGMSGDVEFLAGIIGLAREARGPILEIGCGLSTLVLAIAARSRGVAIVSLEHHPEWAERVSAAVARVPGARVEILRVPLRSYGAFSWYDVPLSRLPEGIALVVCDGPPGDTPGGRVGAIPVVARTLAPGCVVVLDDAGRPAERQALARWAAEFGLEYDVVGREKPFAIGRMPLAPLARAREG